MIVYKKDNEKTKQGLFRRRVGFGFSGRSGAEYVMRKNRLIILASSALALLAFALFIGGKAEAMSACNKSDEAPAAEQARSDQPPLKVGGKCEYESYPGQARILSIAKKEPDASAPDKNRQLYEVRFSFQPNQAINQEWVKIEGKTFLLTLPNGQLPGEEFLTEKGISVGSTLDCRMEVITKGTCTPIMFFW